MQGYSLGYEGHDSGDPIVNNHMSLQVLLDTLSLLQHKVIQLQSLVRTVEKPDHSTAVAWSVQSIISELVSACAFMLPSTEHLNMFGVNGLSEQVLLPHLLSEDGHLGLCGGNHNCIGGNPFDFAKGGSRSATHITLQNHSARNDCKVSCVANNGTTLLGDMLLSPTIVGENRLKNIEEDGEGKSVPSRSYQLIEMNANEILAEHTHFCGICNRGFKRNINLKMHMRGHGEDYKTSAALARHQLGPSTERRFSCPIIGCRKNKQHKDFRPLKTMLCVKNHYRRSHCPKMHTCSKCKIKKFAVVADLKTHEKHCQRDKWQCSCGTRFSRKDKLFGHIALFKGHTPAFASAETARSAPQHIGKNNGESGCVSGIAVPPFTDTRGNSSTVTPLYTATANVPARIPNVSLSQLAIKNSLGENSIPVFHETLCGYAMDIQACYPTNLYPMDKSKLIDL